MYNMHSSSTMIPPTKRSPSCPNLFGEEKKINSACTILPRRRNSWNEMSSQEKNELERFFLLQEEADKGSTNNNDDDENSKYNKFLRQAGAAVIGGSMVAAGIAMLVMPGPGFVVMGAGATVLAKEFPAAQRAMDSAKESEVTKATLRAVESVKESKVGKATQRTMDKVKESDASKATQRAMDSAKASVTTGTRDASKATKRAMESVRESEVAKASKHAMESAKASVNAGTKDASKATQRALENARASVTTGTKGVSMITQRTVDIVKASVNKGTRTKATEVEEEVEAIYVAPTAPVTLVVTNEAVGGGEDSKDDAADYKQTFQAVGKTLEEGFMKGFAQAYTGTKKAYKTASKKLTLERKE